MVEIWTRKHLVYDGNCNNVNLQRLQGMTNNVRFALSVWWHYMDGLQLVLRQMELVTLSTICSVVKKGGNEELCSNYVFVYRFPTLKLT